MILISHRGNIEGPNPERENSPEYIQEALDAGFDVEIDFWITDTGLWLGHDKPQYETSWTELKAFDPTKLWIHCKNIEAFGILFQDATFNCFWHQEDDVALTSAGYIWTYPGKPLYKGAIAVMPERSLDRDGHWNDFSKAGGMCSDYVLTYVEWGGFS
jgi:hypothetical protein